MPVSSPRVPRRAPKQALLAAVIAPVVGLSVALAGLGQAAVASPTTPDDADAPRAGAPAAPAAQGAPDLDAALAQQAAEARTAKGVRARSAQEGRVAAASSDVSLTVGRGAVRRVGTVAEQSGLAEGVPVNQQVDRASSTQHLLDQRLYATVRMRGASTQSSQAVVGTWFGEFSGQTCQARVALLAASWSNETSGAFINSDGSVGSAVKLARTRSGATLSLRTEARSTFRTAQYDCSYVTVQDASGANVLQTFFAGRLTTQYRPLLQVYAGAPVQGAPAGRWTKMRVEVTNASQGAASNVRLRVAGSGVRAQRSTIKVGGIRGRSSRTVSVNVKLAGARQRPITLTATSGTASARSKVTIAREPAARRLGSLSGTYWWGWKTSSSVGWDNAAVMFVDRRWAYVGAPPRGKPRCSSSIRACKRYTYNSRTGTVRIGATSGRVDSKKMTWNGRTHYPLTLPKRGQKFRLTLTRNDYRGCMGAPYCTTWTDNLIMQPNGRFVWTSQSISSIGYPGTPGSIVGVFPPGQRGTYQVLAGGRIRFNYADGKKVDRTIGIERDVRGTASPAGAGVVIGLENFYLP